MKFFIFLLIILVDTVTGQWGASVIPMVPNSGSMRSGILPQGIQPVNSFRLDQINGFQNFNQMNRYPMNNFGNYGPIQPRQMPITPIQQNPNTLIHQNPNKPTYQNLNTLIHQNPNKPTYQNPNIPIYQNPNTPIHQNPFLGNSGFQMMPGRFVNHPKAFGSPQFNPTMVSGFSQNPRTQEMRNTHSEGSLPKFLEGADEITIKEFKRIIRQSNVTYENKIKQVDELVQTLDESKQLLYRQFMKEGDQLQEKHRAEIHKTVSAMSDDAQKIFAKISAILTNPQMPEEERWSRILTIYGQVEPKLRNEFEEKFKPLV